ncbi:Tim10/DDP family zinc finger-domain-containing protein [Peziza echinospora]|nr:Tim10/DDP family zinc finger-domain-containing protein [Peziza echinospora]
MAQQQQEFNLTDLDDASKRELQNFIRNEESKAKIQTAVHSLTDLCWKKCITKPTITAGTLDKSEETCMQNCVDRFLDFQVAVLKNLEGMRG